MAAVADFFPSSLLKRRGSQSIPPSTPLSECSTAENTTTCIDWVPDSTLFEQRVADLASRSGERTAQLPNDWPYQLTGSLVWSGNELKNEEYIYQLSSADVQEIECALHAVKGKVESSVTNVETTEQRQAWCWISMISVRKIFACLP